MDNLSRRIIDFNQSRIPEMLRLKYEAMAENIFRFFRGTNHIFYEDLKNGNSSGSILSTQKVNLVRGINTTGISTSALVQGLYIIHISGIDKPVNLKLMVIN